MAEVSGMKSYSPGYVAGRFIGRLAGALREQRLTLTMVVALAGILIYAGVSGRLTFGRPIATGMGDDAGEQYMRGMRDRDVTELFGSLSPDMRRTVEQQFGRVGPAAVSALFSEEDRRGEKIVGYKLVGSYQTVQGEGLRFYIVQAQRGTDRADVPYT